MNTPQHHCMAQSNKINCGLVKKKNPLPKVLAISCHLVLRSYIIKAYNIKTVPAKNTVQHFCYFMLGGNSDSIRNTAILTNGDSGHSYILTYCMFQYLEFTTFGLQ